MGEKRKKKGTNKKTKSSKTEKSIKNRRGGVNDNIQERTATILVIGHCPSVWLHAEKRKGREKEEEKQRRAEIQR